MKELPMHKKLFWTNIQRIFRDKPSVIGMVVGLIVLLRLGYGFIDIETLKGNLGNTFTILEISLHALLSILFALFVGTHVYKYRHTQVNIKNKATGAVGGFIGILVTGCPSCGITVAAYLGLAGLFASMPFHGIELKILGVIVLFIAEYIAIRDLLVCKIKKK